MKTDQIVEIYEARIPRYIEDFMEAVEDIKLYFDSKSLEQIFHSEEELEVAIGRAMRICCAVGLPLEQHFRKRYISDDIHHTLKHNWRMSKVAYCLLLLNGDPDHPLVERMQWELVKRLV